LDKWTAPEHVKKPLMFAGDNAYVKHEPFGVVLIIAAWNFPWFESLIPMISAIAAGNCVVIKVG
jgi:acyl-CoA reductase-like NAD-dependent aldehyde dehydrogenase